MELLKCSFLCSDSLFYAHITVDIVPFIVLDLKDIIQRCSPLLSGWMDGWDGCVCAVGVAVAATWRGWFSCEQQATHQRRHVTSAVSREGAPLDF